LDQAAGRSHAAIDASSVLQIVCESIHRREHCPRVCLRKREAKIQRFLKRFGNDLRKRFDCQQLGYWKWQITGSYANCRAHKKRPNARKFGRRPGKTPRWATTRNA
jgi:hypothetical protein